VLSLSQSEISNFDPNGSDLTDRCFRKGATSSGQVCHPELARCDGPKRLASLWGAAKQARNIH
jgi:hypothetical protein